MKRNSLTSCERPAEHGFTLVEVVIALFIFALLAAAGVALLSFAVRAQAASAQALVRVADDRRATAILISDLGQAVPRVTRDANGEGRPAFQAEQGDLLLSYVRGGARPQFIEIRLQNGRLVRASASFADGAVSRTPVILAENVEKAEVRFRGEEAWDDQWRPLRTDALPRAIELTVTGRGKAPLRRLFLVGTAG